MNDNIQLDDFAVQSEPEQPTENTYVQPEVDPNKVVGYWKFLGLIVLFAIPVVGFIAGIIFMFAPKNNNIKNYARAFMTATIANLAVTIVIISIILSIVGNMILPSINDALGTDFDNFSTILSTATAAMNGDYATVLKNLRPQLIDMFGEEYAGIIDELSQQKYNKMFKQIIEKDYEGLLGDVKSNEYPDLKSTLGEQEFDGLMTELEKAAGGEHSEFFESLNQSLAPLLNGVKM